MSPRDVPWYPSASKARAAPSRMADRVTSARSCLTMRPTPACVATSSRDQSAFPTHKKTNRLVLLSTDQGTTLENKGSWRGGQDPGGSRRRARRTGMGSQHPSPGTQGAKRFSGHGSCRYDRRVGAGRRGGVGRGEVVRRRPGADGRPGRRPGHRRGPTPLQGRAGGGGDRRGPACLQRVAAGPGRGGRRAPRVGGAGGGCTARGRAAEPAPPGSTAAARGVGAGTDRGGAVGVPAVLARHARGVVHAVRGAVRRDEGRQPSRRGGRSLAGHVPVRRRGL